MIKEPFLVCLYSYYFKIPVKSLLKIVLEKLSKGKSLTKAKLFQEYFFIFELYCI